MNELNSEVVLRRAVPPIEVGFGSKVRQSVALDLPPYLQGLQVFVFICNSLERQGGFVNSDSLMAATMSRP